MTEHTPGPWHICGTGKDFGIYSGTLVTDNKTGRSHYRGCDQVLPFFDCNLHQGMHGKRHMADAKLISAAPDLLEALKEARVQLHELLLSHHLDGAAALTKAVIQKKIEKADLAIFKAITQ